jgi:hypothetical protein
MANVKNYKEQGGDVTVIGGELKLDGGELSVVGGKITNDGAQAAHIADLSITLDTSGLDGSSYMTSAQATALAADLSAIETKLNAILKALEDVGIVASS